MATQHAPHRRPLAMPRHVLAMIVAAGALSAMPRPAAAQAAGTTRPTWELTVPTGRLFPTGAQRDALARGGVSAVQVSHVRRPALAFTGTLGWARSRDVTQPHDPKLDVFLVDIGTEVRAPGWVTHGALSLSPFTGVGAGARRYDHRGPGVTTHHVTAYATAGFEIGVPRVRLRMEVRDYMSDLAAPRNDLVTFVGLRITRGVGR